MSFGGWLRRRRSGMIGADGEFDAMRYPGELFPQPRIIGCNPVAVDKLVFDHGAQVFAIQ
jgi:hypothetical protein